MLNFVPINHVSIGYTDSLCFVNWLYVGWTAVIQAFVGQAYEQLCGCSGEYPVDKSLFDVSIRLQLNAISSLHII